MDDNFSKAKQYVASTKPGVFDSSRFFQLAKPIYESRGCVSFLNGKLTGGEPMERILACMMLAEILDGVHRQPTPAGQAYIQEIDPTALLTQLESIPTNGIGEIWAYWHASGKDMLMKNIEQSSPGKGATP